MSDNAGKMEPAAVTANSEVTVKETESHENGKNETEDVTNVAEENLTKDEDLEVKTLDKPAEAHTEPPAPPAFVPKYKYTDGKIFFIIGKL